MEIVKCANGHWYDMEKSKECPYCKQRSSAQMKLQSDVRESGPAAAGVPGLNDAVTVAMPRQTPREVEITNQGRKGVASGVSSNDSVTVSFFSKHRGTAYVTGWLVGREGPVKGRDYRITHGMNWVGNSHQMDICISEDTDMAEKNCAVVYDGKSNSFFIVPEEGALTYLNGQLLTGSSSLELGDEIRLGRSRFEFVPFCREGHVWEEKE